MCFSEEGVRVKPGTIRGLNPRSATAAVAVALLALTAACSAVPAQKAVLTSATAPLIVNTSYAPATIDPSEGLNEGDFLIPADTYVQLVQYGAKSGPDGTRQVDYTKFKPYLAKSWTISANEETYTFHLNTTFHFLDGTSITAADVKFSFEREVTMEAGGAYYLVDGHYTPPLFKSISTPSPTTIVFNLNVADGGLLSNWSQPAASVVEPSVVDAHGGVVKDAVNTWVAGHIAGGGGPYILSSYNPGVEAVLTANPHYPLKVKSRKVVVSFISNAATLGLDARDGEADVTIGMPPATAKSLSTSSTLKVPAYASPEVEEFGFNTKLAPSNNEDLRQALRYDTPLTAILKKASFGYGKLFEGPVIPDMLGYNGALSKPYPYDPAKAKALMAKSGLTLPVDITVDIEAGDESGANIGPILQDYWSKVGVDVKLQTLSAPVYVTTTETHKDMAYLRTEGPGVPTVPYFLGYDAVCGISFNLTQTCIPNLDTLLTEGGAAPTSQQQPYWNKIIKIWRAYSPKIILFEDYFPVVLNKKVHSYEFSDESTEIQNWGL
jgi:peptide/nickel transport system substrate-binding protein